jgi:hypothetical protein
MQAADNVIFVPQPERIRGLCKTDLIAALERIPGDPIVMIRAIDVRALRLLESKPSGFTAARSSSTRCTS